MTRPLILALLLYAGAHAQEPKCSTVPECQAIVHEQYVKLTAANEQLQGLVNLTQQLNNIMLQRAVALKPETQAEMDKVNRKPPAVPSAKPAVKPETKKESPSVVERP